MSKISRSKRNKIHKKAVAQDKPNFTTIREDSGAAGGLRYIKHIKKTIK